MVYLLHQSIDETASRNPEHPAFRHGGSQVTYAQLAQRSNQLARLLIDRGVRRGDRVGILAGRTLESAIGVYGVMKAGAAFVPLNPTAPPAAVEKVLAQCGIRHLVGHPSMTNPLQRLIASLHPAARPEFVAGAALGDAVSSCDWDTILAGNDTAPGVRLTEQDIAYIISTSGSTGIPKCITHTHHSGLSYAALSRHTYGIEDRDRIGSHSPLHFDMSTLGYLTGPHAGATTVLIPEAHTKMPASLSSHIEQERVSIWYSVPFALVQLLDHGILRERNMTSIRWVLYGGEPFPLKPLRELMNLWPHARFSNVYGPAEVNQCTFHHVPRSDDTRTPIPIGAAWDNTDTLVVDPDGNPVEAGVIGELLVRSPTMMTGYWGRPDLDNSAFATYPIGSGISARFYRTGDLVRETEDGEYLFIGRKDRQVKVRGNRVELGLIEVALCGHEDVGQAAVYLVPQPDGDARLEAALVASDISRNPDSRVTDAELTTFLARQLPSYCLPSRIRWVDGFPRAASGKTDFQALQQQAVA